MAFSVVMPALEMAQETGKLIAWRKREGDRVLKGEPLLEIETDKAVVEVEAPADGVLAGIKASEGAEIPVGQTIAWIVAPGEQPPADDAHNPALPAARAGAHARPEPSQPIARFTVSNPVPGGGVKISPKARRLARELGVDIATLHGSGAGGEILASDVQAARAGTAAAPALSKHEESEAESQASGSSEVSGRTAVQSATTKASGHIEVPTRIGRIMAERMTLSWTTVPHFFVSREIDATALNAYRESIVAEVERTRQIRITHTDLLVALCARVLLQHPRLNASWTSEGIGLHDHVNMGVAIAVDDGVVSAVIPNAHAASLAEIAKLRVEFSDRARAGKLRPADIADATFTISNLGMYKVDQFSAIITPPQAAILAVGSIHDRVVAVEGRPDLRPTMTLTISCDHRVVDGARAAIFLNDLADASREPAKWLA